MNPFARKCLQCRANERNQVYLIAECSRHYENLIKAPRVKHGGAKQAARKKRQGARDLCLFRIYGVMGEGLFLIVVAVRLAIAIAVDVAETVTVVARGGAG